MFPGLLSLLLLAFNSFCSPARAAFLDPGFSGDGKQFLDAGQLKVDRLDVSSDMALQSDGKIILVGRAYNGLDYDFAVVRLHSNGSLDTSFDEDGKLLLPIRMHLDSAMAVAIQGNGKILVAGQSWNGSSHDYAVARLNSNGSLDTSFDGDGKAILPVGGDYATTAYAMAVQNDGKILVTGTDNGREKGFVVFRLHGNGSRDTGFDGDGKRIVPVGTVSDAYAVAVQSDGKILVAGSALASTANNYAFAVIRLNSDGTLDSSFDGDGKRILVVGGGGYEGPDIAYALALQSNGRILLAGSASNQGTRNFAVARLNGNGTFDSSFNGNGKFVLSLAEGEDEARAIALQSDGKIVAAGFARDGATDYAAVRLNANGSLDSSFDGDGKLLLPLKLGRDGATGVALQGDGRIVLSGLHGFNAVRLNTNGSLDAGFRNGVPCFARVGSSTDMAEAMALQSDGKVVLVGSVDEGTGLDMAVSRLNSDGSPDSTFDGDGKRVLPLADDDQAKAIVVQRDGKILVAGSTVMESATGRSERGFIVRLNSNGSLDSSFDGDGKLLPFPDTRVVRLNAVAQQTDGKILVAGAGYGTYLPGFLVARLNPNGGLDTSFAGDGVLDIPMGSNLNSNGVNAIAVQSDGKILLGGYAGNGGPNVFAIARVNVNGSLDTSFDGDGKLLLPIGAERNSLKAVAVQSDGKIVLAGSAYQGSATRFAVARLHPNGSLDTSFDGDGMLILAPGDLATMTLRAMTLQPDGKIILAGYGGDGYSDDFIVARLTATGIPDTTFNADGRLLVPVGTDDDFATGVALQRDGKIVVGGYAYNHETASNDFAVVRLVPTDSALTIQDTRAFHEGNATTPGSTTFTVSLLGQPSSQTITVNYQTADGTANAGSDYIAKSGTLTFAPGQTVKRVTVPFIGDGVAEPNESFFLDLKSASNTEVIDSRGSTYIANDDGPQIFLENAPTVNEGQSGTTPQQFTVRLSAASAHTITVNWAMANGTAGPADYVVSNGTLTFTPGQTSKTIIVQVKGDTTVEPNENYKVNLSKPIYAVIADSQGVAYIRNDDAVSEINTAANRPSQ